MKSKAAEKLATMPQEVSSLLADSEIKLEPGTAPGHLTSSKRSNNGRRVANYGNFKHSPTIHDTRGQGKIYDALSNDQQAGQPHSTWPGMTKSPLPLSVPTPWGSTSNRSTSDPVTLKKKFHQAHGFWPSQTLDAAYKPNEWTRGLLTAFNSIPKHIPLARLRQLLKRTIDERADRSPDDSRVGVSKARQIITLDITTLHRSASWSSPGMYHRQFSYPSDSLLNVK